MSERPTTDPAAGEAPGDPAAARTADPAASAPTGPRRLVLFGIVALVALALDVVSKVLAVAELSDRLPVRLLGGALYIQLARNPGAAFSQGTGFTIVITGLALVIVLVILFAARRLRSRGWAVALGLVLGGALGNLVDRILRAPSPGKGHVVDWISVFGPNGERYPIFNLADSAVCVGAAIIVVLALRGVGLDGRRTPSKREQQRAAAARGTDSPA